MQKERRQVKRMNYADIKQYDVANGPGVRISLFVSGCTHHCKNCFNEETWDFQYGQSFTEAEEDRIVEYLRPDYIAGLTLLGGEPFEHVNQKGLLPLLRKIRAAYPDGQKSIWAFSGYLFDREILGKMYSEWEETKELLSYIDVLVDGRFVEEVKDVNLRFKGSSNQRIILVQESLKALEEAGLLPQAGADTEANTTCVADMSDKLVLWNPPEYVQVEVKS